MHCILIQHFCSIYLKHLISETELALVAQLDARQTGDQEVVGSSPAGSATFFRGD